MGVFRTCFFWLLAAAGLLSSLALVHAAPVCRGAGVAKDAPLLYLVTLSREEAKLPGAPLVSQTVPEKREGLAAVMQKKRESALYLVALTNRKRAFLYHGLAVAPLAEVDLFRRVDLNADGIDDLMVYTSAGPFFHISLYAGCGDDFFAPVGAFASRDVPPPADRVMVKGIGWSEYAVLAPEKNAKPDEPMKNWMVRHWQFDGRRYRQVFSHPPAQHQHGESCVDIPGIDKPAP